MTALRCQRLTKTMSPDTPRDLLTFRIREVEKDIEKLEGVPKDVALLVVAVDSLESRFRNLQRAFYFFGSSFVVGAIGFGFTALRLSASPSPSSMAQSALSYLGIG